MAHTVARVTGPNGRAYDVVGDQISTVTDVTWLGATASETVTAAELGLSTINKCQANINAMVASATGVEATVTVASTGASVVLALNTVAAAGTGQAGSIVRVYATGKP